MIRSVFIFAILAVCNVIAAADIVDPTFNVGTGANGIVEHVLQQPDGKILICGNFTAFNGQSKAYIARLNSDGSVDTGFTGGAAYWVRHMALQSDGKIVIGGYFTSVEGIKRNRIARLNTNGTLDQSFDPGTGLETIIAPGIDGNVDPFVMWCEVLPGGRIVAVGNFRTYNGESSVGIVGITSTGARDTSFNVGGGLDSWGRTIRPLANGQIMVGGWFQNYNGHTANRAARINTDGSIDTTFNPFYGDKTAVYSIVQLSNGQFITSGHSLNEQGLFMREVERLNADGSVDQNWPGFTNEKTECLYLQPNGKLILSGHFSQADGVARESLARFNADGSLDTTFVANADNFVWTVTPALDAGQVLVSGGFSTINGVARGGVARLNLPEGSGAGTISAPAPTIVNMAGSSRFSCAVNSTSGFNYTLQYKTGASATNWISLTAVAGTGGQITLTDPRPVSPRFYRVEVR